LSLARYYNWLIFRTIDPQLHRVLKKYGRGRLADIGCGSKPYKSIASKYFTEHVGIDHAVTAHDKSEINIESDAYSIPVESESFETVLCTDVLEHLEEPDKAIQEAYRILKNDGIAIYTVPLIWHLHEEPRDFYRYTRYGLKYLFEKNHFKIIELVALSGFTITFAQELSYFLMHVRGKSKVNPFWWVIPPSLIIIQSIAYLIGKIEKNEMFTAEYLIVARK
jgi:SAM-dependent methyltransferase